MLAILRAQPDNEAYAYNMIDMMRNVDNLEAIVWQLYDAGFRPNLK